MEILLVLLLAAVFIGPSAYHLYERYKHPQRARSGQGPSYARRMLGMLTPVFLLVIFLTLLAVGLYVLRTHFAVQ